jgi:hypothetical protein
MERVFSDLVRLCKKMNISESLPKTVAVTHQQQQIREEEGDDCSRVLD